MNEKIDKFIETLKKHMQGVPREEADKAVGYYTEYLSDALEAGKDIEEVISQLDPPEKIAGIIKAEASAVIARQSPGLKNYTGVLRNASKGVSKPFIVVLLSLFVFLSYCMVIVLYAGAFAVLTGAVVTGLGMIYEAFLIPSSFIMEILGTIGAGFFGSGICLLVAYVLYKSGRLFIRASASLVQRMVRKSARPVSGMSANSKDKKSNPKRVIFACLLLSAAGLILFSVSGLPVRFFTIFNSMKPENLTVKTADYDPAVIDKISIVTAHSHIRFVKSPTDRITISYEQPDWLECEMGSSGSLLSFYEKSNGRLPLFKLVSIHESVTEVTVSLPDGYEPAGVTLESTGGLIDIEHAAGNIQAKTYTGGILLNTLDAAVPCNIEAVTGSGSIEVNGVPAGQNTNNGTEYYSGLDSGKTISLRSSQGNITITQ